MYIIIIHVYLILNISRFLLCPTVMDKIYNPALILIHMQQAHYFRHKLMLHAAKNCWSAGRGTSLDVHLSKYATGPFPSKIGGSRSDLCALAGTATSQPLGTPTCTSIPNCTELNWHRRQS